MTYDALGRMVEQNRSGAYTQFVYGPHGGKFAIMSGQTLQKAIVPLVGNAQAVYNANGLLYYGHSDHLGSIRLGSSSSRTVSFDLAYAPFGETYASSGSADPAFTGQRQDTVSGVYDFPAREYSNEGRWASPDPSGISAFHLTDPQSINRYVYARNTPLSVVDPTGLDEVFQCFFCDEGGGGDGGGVSDAGGGSSDPTSGGSVSNSGNDVCGIGNLCSDGNGNLTTSMDSNDLTGGVTVSLSDGTQPTIETQNAPLSSTLSYDDQKLQLVAQGVVQGAGPIGDLSTIGLFYGASILGGAGLEMMGAFEAPEALTLGDINSQPAVTWLTDVTEPGSQFPNFNATTNASDAQATLSSNGYTVSGTSSTGGPVMTNGTNTYTFYGRTSLDGASGMQSFNGSGTIIKYTLVGP